MLSLVAQAGQGSSTWMSPAHASAKAAVKLWGVPVRMESLQASVKPQAGSVNGPQGGQAPIPIGSSVAI